MWWRWSSGDFRWLTGEVALHSAMVESLFCCLLGHMADVKLFVGQWLWSLTGVSTDCVASFRSMALFQNNNVTLVYVRACVSIWRCCRCLKCVFSVYIMVLAALVLWIFAVQVLSKTEVLWIKQKVFLPTTFVYLQVLFYISNPPYALYFP